MGVFVAYWVTFLKVPLLLLLGLDNMSKDMSTTSVFKTLPPLSGNTAENWREFATTLKHHVKIAGVEYAQILDMSVDAAALSKPHNETLFAVMSLAMGNGSLCPSAKE